MALPTALGAAEEGRKGGVHVDEEASVCFLPHGAILWSGVAVALFLQIFLVSLITLLFGLVRLLNLPEQGVLGERVGPDAGRQAPCDVNGEKRRVLSLLGMDIICAVSPCPPVVEEAVVVIVVEVPFVRCRRRFLETINSRHLLRGKRRISRDLWVDLGYTEIIFN